MDASFLAKNDRDSPNNTRSSPKKKKVDPPTRKVSYKWDDERTTLFFNLCVEEHKDGKCSGAVLTNESFKKIAQELTQAFGKPCSESQVQKFWNQQKRYWTDVYAVGMEPLYDSTYADDAWWDQAIQERPRLKKIRNKDLKELLHYGGILFRNDTATGEHVVYAATASLSLGLPRLTRTRRAKSKQTLGCGSTTGSKRKSVKGGQIDRLPKKAMMGIQLVEAFREAIEAKVQKETMDPISTGDSIQMGGAYPTNLVHGSGMEVNLETNMGKLGLPNLRNKNLHELIHYGDTLFKKDSAMGEHAVYPSTASGSHGLPGLTLRPDMFDQTLGCGSTTGSTLKSVEVGPSDRSQEKEVTGMRLVEAFYKAVKAKVQRETQFP